MTIKFAHLADMHLGYEQYRLPFRAEEFRKSFEEAIKIAVNEKVDFILIAGDLFHKSNPSPQTIKDAIDILSIAKREDIPVFAIEGNHDRSVRKISAYHLLESLGLLYLLGFSEEKKESEYQITEKINDRLLVKGVFRKGNREIEIQGMRYMSHAWFDRNKLANYFKPKGDSILMLHQGIKEMMGFVPLETQRDYFEITLEDLPKGFLYYAMGHIHKKWLTNKDEGIVAYPGSLERWDFGDYEMRYRLEGDRFKPFAGEDKGIWIVENFKPKFVPIRVRPFYDIRLKASETTARKKLKELMIKIPKESFLRVVIEWEKPYDVSFIHDIFKVRHLYIRTKFGKPKFTAERGKMLKEYFSEVELKVLEVAGVSEKDFSTDSIDEVIKLILGHKEEAKKIEAEKLEKEESRREKPKEEKPEKKDKPKEKPKPTVDNLPQWLKRWTK